MQTEGIYQFWKILILTRKFSKISCKQKYWRGDEILIERKKVCISNSLRQIWPQELQKRCIWNKHVFLIKLSRMLVRILDLIGNQHAWSNVATTVWYCFEDSQRNNAFRCLGRRPGIKNFNCKVLDFIHNFHVAIFARWYRKRKVKVFDCFYT